MLPGRDDEWAANQEEVEGQPKRVEGAESLAYASGYRQVALKSAR